jgi:serine phosphatase RsbU (regulator of sigma subunit)
VRRGRRRPAPRATDRRSLTGGFEELVPAWMFPLRRPMFRFAAAIVVPAVFGAPLVLLDRPDNARLGPFLVIGLVVVAALGGWWATLLGGVVTTAAYWWYGVPVTRSLAFDGAGDATAVLSMGALVVGLTLMARRVEESVDDVRALDRTRRAQASAEGALRRATERAMSEVEGVLQLSNALAKARTMSEVAKVATETIAMPAWPTSASVAVVKGDRLRILAARGASATTIEALERVDLASSSWLGDVIAGTPAIVDDRERFAADHPDARVLALYPCGSWAVIPFRSENTTGLLSLYWFTPQPLAELARYYSLVAEILATALERAHAEEQRQTHLVRLEQAFAEADRIARTLSTTLLPPQLPDMEGFTASGWLIPADGRLAGDFYDLFSVTGGDWVAVLGDVCGKGAEAAAVTSLARYAARATALADPDPSHIADVVNKALQEDESDVFCTMGIVRFSREHETVEVTLAGHPQARMVADGVTRLGRYGSVLGYATSPPTVDQRPLPAGGAVVLFSDGLVERHPDFGEDELDRVLHHAPRRSAEAMAAYVRERILEVPARRQDDLALLVIMRDG